MKLSDASWLRLNKIKAAADPLLLEFKTKNNYAVNQ